MVLQETYLKKIDPGANFDAKAMAANQKTNSMECPNETGRNKGVH